MNLKFKHVILLLFFCLPGGSSALAQPASANNALIATNGLHLKKIPFTQALDIYGKLSHRVLLVHPAIDWSAFSIDATWTNQTPSQAEIIAAFDKVFAERKTVIIVDGGKFLQIIPAPLKLSASPNSKDIPVVTGESRGTIDLQNIPVSALANLYGEMSGLRRIGSEPVTGNISYFKTNMELSKPEMIYAFQTLLAWNGTKVIINQDGTFSLAKR